ncbi:MAG TPA: MFS transporter [Rhodospirillaceae bacterium]|nr:MAG: acriflavin resistance protein [Alphaproteobacteria bacterium GWF2_58_20]HAU29337.1 MFS transporter [Rhodospirillaceae bacterium]
MTTIISFCLGRSRAVITALIFLLLSGWSAWQSIPREAQPDIDIPYVFVSANLEGISPGDSERLLIKPLEKKLRNLTGVKKMTSTGYLGGCNVFLEFESGTDIDQAVLDVRQKVDDAKPELPTETKEPIVQEISFSNFPVLVVTLSGDVPERTLVNVAKTLQDEIEAIDTVLEATLTGDREEIVELVADPVLIQSYGLNGATLSSFFARSNRLVAAGNLDNGKGRFGIKVPGIFETVDDIWNMPVKVSGDAAIRLKDIIEIRKSFKDSESFARVNGARAIGLEVKKRTGANIIDTIRKVRSVVDEQQASWPSGIMVTYSQDRSEDIKSMLSDLTNNLASAVLLVLIVCIGALGVRSSMLIGISVPGSFLITMLVLNLLGLTLNIIVMFSLILGSGMLVDASIVITEYADRRMAEGETPKGAYREAAIRMFMPIFASQLTTISAFLPLLFWPGIVGDFMSFLPKTIIILLLSCTLMATIFIPTIGTLLGRPGSVDNQTLKALSDSETGNLLRLPGFTGRYIRILDRALKRPGKIVLIAIATLILVLMAYGKWGEGVSFFPDVEPDTATIYVHARGNLSIKEQDTLIHEVENRVLGTKYVTTVYARTGAASASGEGTAKDVIGSIALEFTDWDTRPPASYILAEIIKKSQDIPGIKLESRQREMGPPQGKPIQIEISAANPDLLMPVVTRLSNVMESIPGLRDIEDSRPLPGIDWELTVDRLQAAKFGLDLSSVGESVRLVTNGVKVGSYRPNDTDDEVDILLRYPLSYRSLEQLEKIQIETASGSIPISNFVHLTPIPKVEQIDRIDSKRVMTIKADVEEGILASAKIAELKAMIEQADLPNGVSAQFSGEDEDQKESSNFLKGAFLGALFLIAAILITQFNSFYSTFLILSAIILSTIGVFVGLLIIQQPFSIVMTGIAVIALAGIVVNNNIILIDTYDQLRRENPDTCVKQIALRTCAQRLRPVLLTTTTTILGLMPMAFRTNIDFFTPSLAVNAPSTQFWFNMSSTMSFGLAFATMLTLVVTPCALVLRGNFIDALKRMATRLHKPLHHKRKTFTRN